VGSAFAMILELLFLCFLQGKLKRLLQYLDFKDVKVAAMKGVALDDSEPSETGEKVFQPYMFIFYLFARAQVVNNAAECALSVKKTNTL